MSGPVIDIRDVSYRYDAEPVLRHVDLAAHQIRSLRQQRVLGMLGATMLGVAALAGVLGWSSHETIVGVYDETAKLLATRGTAAPPNPFLLKPALALPSNMVIYITLIGALAALVVGHA